MSFRDGLQKSSTHLRINLWILYANAPRCLELPSLPTHNTKKRVEQLTALLEEKHKTQGEPLTTKKALLKFNQMMKFNAVQKEPSLSAVWDMFKSFCELAIDCSGEVFQIEDISKGSPLIVLTRFWYEPGIVSDELYMAECRVEIKANAIQLDVPDCQFESLPEFVEHVESKMAFRDGLPAAVVSKITLYAGSR